MQRREEPCGSCHLLHEAPQDGLVQVLLMLQQNLTLASNGLSFHVSECIPAAASQWVHLVAVLTCQTCSVRGFDRDNPLSTLCSFHTLKADSQGGAIGVEDDQMFERPLY